MNPKSLTARQVRARFGGISDMSLHRWLHNEAMGFPKPIVIQRRRYFRLDQIEYFEELRTARANVGNRLSNLPNFGIGSAGDDAALATDHEKAIPITTGPK